MPPALTIQYKRNQVLAVLEDGRVGDPTDPDIQFLTRIAALAIQDANRADHTMATIIKAGKELRDALKQAAAALHDTETRLNAERRLRQRAETQRDQALQARPAGPDLTTELDELRTRLHAASTDRDLYAELLDQAETERDNAILDRADLATRLADLQPATPDPKPPTPEPTPASFADVIAQATHPLLVFTHDPTVTAHLDDFPQAPAWRRRTAAALATATAYATAKATARAAGHQPGPELADLGAYVRHGGPEVTISAATIALGEFRRVQIDPRHNDTRIFPVPPEIHYTGQAAMHAHIRIGATQSQRPRLHFYDDTNNTGKIVIGYLGPHLPTWRTN